MDRITKKIRDTFGKLTYLPNEITPAGVQIQGAICYNCGSNNLSYEMMEITDFENVKYPYECNDCKHEGTEHYIITLTKVTAD